jgi:hypothetical protein
MLGEMGKYLKSPWLRFATFVVLLLGMHYHKSVLPALGYSDSGQARWVYAGALAFLFMAYIVLSSPKTLGAGLAHRSRVAKRVYTGIFFAVGMYFLTEVFAGVDADSPAFLVGLALIAGLVIFEQVMKRLGVSGA